MLPVVHDVVEFKHPMFNKPGEMREGVLREHAISCKLRAHGRYIIGSEEADVSGPFINLGVAGERDGNGLTGPVAMYWCRFDARGIVSGPGKHVTLNLNSATIRRSHFRPLSPGELKHAVLLFRDLLRLSRAPDAHSQLLCGSRVLELLALWSRPPAVTREARAVNLYKDLIEQYALDSDVSLAALAERVGYNADYLGVLFQREVGMSPVHFRGSLRIAHARELLTTSTLSVAQIARECGFSDARYFSRAFRRDQRVSPRDYVKLSSSLYLRNIH